MLPSCELGVCAHHVEGGEGQQDDAEGGGHAAEHGLIRLGHKAGGRRRGRVRGRVHEERAPQAVHPQHLAKVP
eukprot:4780516-Pyramimonas_sp.AAC.1